MICISTTMSCLFLIHINQSYQVRCCDVFLALPEAPGPRPLSGLRGRALSGLFGFLKLPAADSAPAVDPAAGLAELRAGRIWSMSCSLRTRRCEETFSPDLWKPTGSLALGNARPWAAIRFVSGPELNVRANDPSRAKAFEVVSEAVRATLDTREKELVELWDCLLADDSARDNALFSFFSAMKTASFSLVVISSSRPSSIFCSAAIRSELRRF